MTRSIKSLHVLAPATAAALLAGSAHAAPIFTDDFESPDVAADYTVGNTSQQIDTNKWVLTTQGFASSRTGIVDEAENGGSGYFADPTGAQAWAGRYDDNAGLTSAFGKIGAIAAGQTITVTFDAVVDGYLEAEGASAGSPGNGSDLDAYLVLFDGASTRNDVRSANANTTAILARLTGNQRVTTSYQTFQITYTVGDPVIDNNGAGGGTATTWDSALLGQDIAVRFGENNNAIIDNVSVTVIPEPASLALLGLAGLLGIKRRRA